MAVNWGTRTLVVTGAAGWLGQRLVDTLLRGLPEVPSLSEPDQVPELRALVLPGQDVGPLRALGPRVSVVEGDLRDADTSRRLFAGTEGAIVFHAAGVIHPRRIADFHDVNVTGTRSLLRAAEAAGARRAVVVSSNSPIGCNPRVDHVFNETSPFNPYMGYGKSKMDMELAVAEFRSQAELEVVIVRPPWFYGPFQPPRQTLFFEMIRAGRTPIVGGGENRRSMVYIDNLCQGVQLAALVPRARGEVYWIADQEPYTMNQIVDTVERLMADEFGFDVRGSRLRLPALASDVALLVDRAIQGVGLYHQKFHVLSEMSRTIACSVEKARRELGYQPTVALEEGMRRSLSWCIERGMLRPERPGRAA